MKKILLTAAEFALVLVCIGSLPRLWAGEADFLLKEQPHTIYHVIKNKTLFEAATLVALRSGIDFQLDSAIKSDMVFKKLAADDWGSALSQLLQGYNYSTVFAKGKIATVFVSGRNGSGLAQDAVKKWLPVAAENPVLPLRYRDFAPGSVLPVKLPITQLAAAKLGKKLLLDLPIGQYTVKHDDKIDDGHGAMTWMGYLEDEGKGYRVYLSQGEAGIMGNIATPDGNYEVETVNGDTYLVDQNRAGLSLGGFDNDQADNGDLGLANAAILPSAVKNLVAAINPTAMALSSTTGTASTTLASSTTTTSGPVVDVMVLYTTVNQTAAYAKQRIKYLVNITNRAYQDSFINMRLRLVHARPTNYIEKSANNAALNDLANAKGAFANIPALRNQYGADVVVLLRPYYVSTSGNCGVAYVGFASGSGANPGNAFGAISDGKSRDAPTNYYCGISTFAHEVGHMLGTVHDRAYAGFPGKFPYSYAWGIKNKFGTIMSYFGPPLMVFATPKLTAQCVGLPCGYAAGTANASDQSRTINDTAPSVAKYRATKVTTPVIQ